MNPYLYKVLKFSNYDGDSFRLDLDLGFELTLHQQCRLMGVDTPELRGGTEESKRAGYLARDVVLRWATEGMEQGTLYFNSENLDGKFGRPLGDLVRVFDSAKESLRDYLVMNNYGVPYHGGSKAEVMQAHEINLVALQERGEL